MNKKNPSTAEAELTAEWAAYSTDGSTVISADSVFEWIEDHYPDFSDEQIEALVDGADINGDGDVNYAAYTKLVCQTILKLDSEPLKATFDSIDTNKDGQISQEELNSVTGRMSLEQKLANLDLDHSGTLSFIEFLYSIFKTKGQSYLKEGRKSHDIHFICLKPIKHLLNTIQMAQAKSIVMNLPRGSPNIQLLTWLRLIA